MPSARASKIPLLMACNPSHADGVINVEVDDESGPLGTAVHAANASLIRDGDLIEAKNLAARYSLEDVDELDMLINIGRKAWLNLQQYFPAPLVEQSMQIELRPGITLTGQSDLISLSEDYVKILDWKSGFRQRNYTPQLLAYALMACRLFKKPRFSVTLVWLREGVTDTQDGDEASLNEFAEQIANAIENRNSEKYRINEMCELCPRFADCPARRKVITNVASDLAGVSGNFPNIRDMGLALPQTIMAVRSIRRICDLFLDQTKVEIRKDGPIPVGDGTYYSLKEVKKDQLKPAETIPVAKRYVADESKLLAAISISKGSLIDIIRAESPKGQKSKVADRFLADLEAAGAINKRVEEHLDHK